MSRLHHFLPSYLSMPDCPTQESSSVNAAVLQLAQHPESRLARLVWISSKNDRANHAMILQTIPELGLLQMRGSTGTHSVVFKTTSDLSRALIHAQGFWDRQVIEASRPPSVTDGRRGASWDKAAELVAQLAAEIEKQRRLAEQD